MSGNSLLLLLSSCYLNQVLKSILQLLMLHIQSCSMLGGALGESSPSLSAVEVFYQQELSHVARVPWECDVEVHCSCTHYSNFVHQNTYQYQVKIWIAEVQIS